MAKKTKVEEPTQVEKSVGEIISKTDSFIEKYWKQVLTGIAAVIIIVLGILAVRHFYLIPREKDAETALFPGQYYFENQQWEVALNGDSIDYIGFAAIIDEYSGTPSANLAKYYAGISNAHLGNYEEALKQLKSYSGKDNLLAAQALGAIGDCEVNLGDAKKGASSFVDAAKKANSSILSPIYWQKAAVAYESLGDYKSALDAYTTIKNKYPQSQEASAVDKYIERAKTL
jgi:tetratricopeptide (TPR) repeat protein